MAKIIRLFVGKLANSLLLTTFSPQSGEFYLIFYFAPSLTKGLVKKLVRAATKKGQAGTIAGIKPQLIITIKG